MKKKIGKKRKKSLKKESFKLVNFSNKYLKTIYIWRNEKSAIKNSLSKKKFSYENHKLWIRTKLKNRSNMIFIFLKNNRPVGTCSVIKSKNYFNFNYLIRKSSRNKGYAKIMLKKIINLLKKSKIKRKIIASVIKKNIQSLNLLSNNGFKIISMKKSYFILKLQS